MSLLQQLLDLFLNLDVHLAGVIAAYGPWTYLLLLIVVFSETGLVVTPFLPGDSLLFAAGAFAAQGVLHPHTLVLLLSFAAITGDTVNYAAGAWVGPRIFRRETRFIRRDHLIRTERFYEEHGARTIVLARFIPIIRTFAPFVAGVGSMAYPRFLVYNVVGGIAWVGIFVYGGFLFGNIPAVREHFEWVIVGIIAVSLLPLLRACRP